MRSSATRRVGTRAWTLAALLALPALIASSPAPLVLAAPDAHADGSVVGTLRLTAVAGAPPPMLSPYARPRYRPPARDAGAAASPAAAVVYLQGAKASAGAPDALARIVQQNRTILPHVTVIQVETRVEFPNDDDVFHNLFSLSSSNRFNLGRYPPGDSRSERFGRAGVVRLFCDIHSEMGGVILVLDTPHFTQPDEDGRFRITGVPAGEYTAVVWHEIAGTDSTRVVVREGTETSVDFALGR